MTRRINQTTGQEEEQGADGQWYPAATPSETANRVAPLATPAAVNTSLPPAAPPPAPTGPGSRGIIDDIAANTWDAYSFVGIRPSSWFPGAPDAPNPGSHVGASAGAFGSTLTPPAPLNLDGFLSEDQAYIDQLQELYAGIGEGSAITAPQLPSPSAEMFTPDPGNQVVADHATRRQSQVDELLAELRGGREEEVNRRTSKWATFGRWLGEVSAVDDLSQGGRLMTQVLAENDDMRRDLRNETLQLIQMGWSAEDAVVQAQAQLLSGQAESQRALATAQFGRDTSQTGLDFQASVAEGERTSRGAGQRLNAGVAIAQATRDAQRESRQREDAVLGILSENPQYSNQAFGAMAENLTTDPGTQGAIVSTSQERQLNSALMNYVGQYAGTDNQQALRFLRNWDSRLTVNDLENMTPQQLMMRLTSNPSTARAAFAANRDYLLRSQQFGAMAPAQ